MKFHKFNRKRYQDPWKKYLKAQKKASYLANKGKVRVLDSLYTENKTWGALHKAWQAYVISKNKVEPPQMEYYARVIQKLQYELGLPVSSFPDLNIFPLEGEGHYQDDSDGLSTPYDIEHASKQDMKEW
jgi:hypothetical protein